VNFSGETGDLLGETLSQNGFLVTRKSTWLIGSTSFPEKASTTSVFATEAVWLITVGVAAMGLFGL